MTITKIQTSIQSLNKIVKTVEPNTITYSSVKAFIERCEPRAKTNKLVAEKLERLIALNDKTFPANIITNEEINDVYEMLQARKLHPSGTFDNAGRFYLDDSDLVDVRSPSRSYPYSQMVAGRTKKFVKALVGKYRPQSKAELIKLFS